MRSLLCLILFALSAMPLAAQRPDSVAVQLVPRTLPPDTVRTSYFTVVDTVGPDSQPSPPDTTPPPAPSGTFTACENLPPASRIVNVSTQSALASALSAALPGDRIAMAPGTYTGAKNLTRDGTAANPIVVCGPKTAHWTGTHYADGMNRWIFQGFTIRNGGQTFHAKRSSFNRVQGLEIYSVGQEAIHFLCGSSDNVMQANWIHDTGTSAPAWGEAIYLGTWPGNASDQCGSSAADLSHRNQVIENRFGPNVRSEDVDAKENTKDGVIRGNVSDGAGKRSISGNFQSSFAFKSSSSGYQVTDNVVNGGAATTSGTGGAVGDAFNVLGSNHTFRRNKITMGLATGYGFRLSGSGHFCGADNTVSPANRRSNVACNQ